MRRLVALGLALFVVLNDLATHNFLMVNNVIVMHQMISLQIPLSENAKNYEGVVKVDAVPL